MKAPCLVLGTLLLSSVAVAQNWFEAPRYYPQLSSGRIQLLDDLDGNGLTDLIWIAPKSIQVWFNNGNEEFTPGPVNVPDIKLDLPDMNPRTYPQLGDVNDDGVKDLVFALDLPYPDGRVAVFFGLGGGSFSPSHLIVPPDPPFQFAGWMQSVCLGDLDQDGHLEIAEAHDTSTGFSISDLR